MSAFAKKKILVEVESTEFAARLKHRRELRGFTQTDLSKISGVGAANIGGYENGAMMTVETMCKLCDALDVTPNELLGYSSLSVVRAA